MEALKPFITQPRRMIRRSFDKRPTTKCPRVSARPFNKDKTRSFECKEFGHLQKDCHLEGNPGPKKFEDYNYTYSVPDIQPQMQINPAIPIWPQPMTKP